MKSAKEARLLSAENVSKVEKQTKVMLSHLENKIDEASKLGHFHVEPFILQKSQIEEEVLKTVEKKMKDLGYKFSTEEKFSDQTIKITITW